MKLPRKIFKIKIMELSELENQLLELQNIKNIAVKERNYEVAARTRDKINALIELFKFTFISRKKFYL